MSTCKLSPVLSLALSLGTVASAAAQSLPVVNFGFEANAAPAGGYAILVPTGWTLHDPASIINGGSNAVGAVNASVGTFYPGGAPQGTNAALIYLAGNRGGGEVGLRQTLPSVLAANTRYELRVEVGNIASGFGPPGNTFYNLNGFPGYRIDLFAGPTLIARDQNTLAPTIPEGQFRTSTLAVDIGAAHTALNQPLTIWLVNLNAAGTAAAPGIEVNFDNVRLTATALTPPCPADFNNDGFLDFTDFDAFVIAFEAGDSRSDFNADGFLDFTDFDAFVAAFENGC